MQTKLAYLGVGLVIVGVMLWWMESHPFAGMVVTDKSDALGRLVFYAIFLLIPRLERGIGELPKEVRMKVTAADLAIALALVGASIGMISSGNERMLVNAALLPFFAFTIGRRRGFLQRILVDPPNPISDVPNEIWAKQS